MWWCVPVAKGRKNFKKSHEQCATTLKCLLKQLLLVPSSYSLTPHPFSVYVARLQTARTCISLILDFLWLPESAPTLNMADWKCQGIKAPHSPSSSPQPVIERCWCITTPAPLPSEWHNSEVHVVQHFPEFSSRNKLRLPTAVTCMVMHTVLASFPFLFISLPLPVFPRIISQINYLYLNSCLRFCF